MIQNILQSPQYGFLRTNPVLGGNIIFLTLGGSYAYGTNVPTSDVDVRGVCHNTRQSLIGFTPFEQFIDNPTDTTIYSFNKLIHLLISCNPNTIEILGCKPEHYFMQTKTGTQLLANRKLFLSKRAVRSFMGYANAQLNRLQNNLARFTLQQSEQEEHIKRSIDSAMLGFEDRYKSFKNGSIVLTTDISQKADFDTEIFMDINLTHYPLRDFVSIWSEMSSIIKEYSKLNHRNKKKTDEKLDKHAMHLVRLYLMCLDILEKQEIITHRQQDLPLLMDIRNGKYRNQNGTYNAAFYDILHNLEKRLEYAKNNTVLPDKPNLKAIEAFVMAVNQQKLADTNS
ncbi:MAG: nucleotidyltransferase domain-containing protein [Defluviitaleaceae bacterium]|nr:nucleotidyltransferase domain-containing protein [Defluviitaleaceae bacterium]